MLAEITTAHFKGLPTAQKLENHQPRIVLTHKEKKKKKKLGKLVNVVHL